MSDLVPIELDDQLWERVLLVSPLVLVGTREPDGDHDFAPKHRVVMLPGHFGFVCRPSHATWRNAAREQVFTVSWPKPRQIVMTSAAASPRCEDGEKNTMRALPIVGATSVAGVLLDGGHFHLECRVDRIIDDLGQDGLILGRIVAAHADPTALRHAAVPDATLVHDHPLLAYLHPSQFARIDRSTGFPFPKGFTRE